MSCYFSIMSARASPLTDNRNEGGVSALRLKIKSVFNGYLTGLLRCTSPELQIHLGWDFGMVGLWSVFPNYNCAKANLARAVNGQDIGLAEALRPRKI